jgi:hypothetical protein
MLQGTTTVLINLEVLFSCGFNFFLLYFSFLFFFFAVVESFLWPLSRASKRMVVMQSRALHAYTSVMGLLILAGSWLRVGLDNEPSVRLAKITSWLGSANEHKNLLGLARSGSRASSGSSRAKHRYTLLGEIYIDQMKKY